MVISNNTLNGTLSTSRLKKHLSSPNNHNMNEKSSPQQAIHTHYIYPQIRSRANPALDLVSVKKKGDVREPFAKSTRLFNLSDVPVFSPTNEQFADPASYISQISNVGKHYGMVKIIPPDDWNPPFSLDTEVCKIFFLYLLF